MIDTLDFCEICSKKNDKVGLNITDDYFDFHTQGRNKQHYITAHQVVTSLAYHQMKTIPKIIESLQVNKCYLMQHAWEVHEWDIVNIGFL